jgi:dTDP-4-dehydrorhamnose reductase
MRVLIFGGDLMLGHQPLCRQRGEHDVRVTFRQGTAPFEKFHAFTAANASWRVDLHDVSALLPALGSFSPDAIINAVGVVKQGPDAQASIASVEANALLPDRSLLLAKVAAGLRLGKVCEMRQIETR